MKTILVERLLEKLPSSLVSLGQMVGDTDAAACFRAGAVLGQVEVMIGATEMCIADLKELSRHFKGDCECPPDEPEPTSKGGDA